MLKIIDNFALSILEVKTEMLYEDIEKLQKSLKKQGFLKADLKFEDDDLKLYEILECVDTDKVHVFDSECIENDGDYASLFWSFLEYLGEDLSQYKIKSVLTEEGESCFRMIHLGLKKKWKKTWEQEDDYVSQEFLEFANSILDDLNLSKFVVLPAASQEIEMLFLSKDEADLCTQLLNREQDSADTDIGWFVIIYMFVGLIIGLILFFVGWLYFDKLLIAFLIGVGFIILFTFVGMLRSGATEEPLTEAEKKQAESMEKVLKLIEEGKAFKK